MVHLLDEPYRSAIRRSELEGVPMRVIADELGISVSGVKSRVQRGRAKLKELVFSCCTLEVDASGRPLLSEDHTCTTPDCGCGRAPQP
jgi:RNA polymerase sigma-70 factor (ECF subfamily)